MKQTNNNKPVGVSQRLACTWCLNGFALTALLCILAFGPFAQAQYSSGVDGTVQDPSGAIVPGATVQLTNVNLGVTNSVQTNGTGYFRIDSIAAGTYRMQISAPGFKTWEETALVLQVGQIRTVAPKLELGATNTTVTVSGSQASLDLTSSSTTAIIGSQTVEQVPLVGQDVYKLAAIAPGVTGPGLTSGDNFANQYGIQINAAGQRQESNTFMIDGAFVDTPSLGGEASISPNPEIVESIQVNTNEFDASKGRTSGANVLVYTRSGTNEFHGSGDYFFLNNTLTARTEFQQSIPGFTRQEGGAELGGPILRNKLFFFGGIDFLRSSSVYSGSTATETQDFVNWAKTNLPNSIGTAYLLAAPPVSYPTTGLLTVAQVEAQTPGYFAPPANIPSTLAAEGTLNFNFSIPRNGRQWNLRVDNYIGQHDRIYATGVRTVLVSDQYNGPRPALNNPITINATFLNVGWTHTFSPHLLNETGVSYVRPSSTYGVVPPKTAFPEVYVAGISSMYPYDGPWAQNTLGWREALTATIKSHELKVGAYLENIRENNLIPSTEYYQDNSLLDFIQDEPTYQQGYPIDLTTGQGVTPRQNYEQEYYSAYVQDDWAATRRLKVNLGMRYDSQGQLGKIINPPFSALDLGSGTTKDEQVANAFVTAPPKGNWVVDHDVWQVSPRAGFSWDLFGNGRTALRGGFGLFADRDPYRDFTGNMGGNLPNTYTPSLSVYSGQTPVMNICQYQGYGLDCPLIIPTNIQFDQHGGIVGQRANEGGVSKDSRMGEIENWTFSVQQQLSGNLVLEANYSGMEAHFLPIGTNVNRFAGDLIQNKGALTRLNQSFGSLYFQTTDGNATGNFGSLMLTKQTSRGFSLRGIYTYGKSLDEYSTAGTLQGACACETTSIVDASNFKAQHGRTDFDIHQQISLDGVWTLPNPFSDWRRNVLGGWRLAGLALLHSGFPFTVSTSAPFQAVFDANGNVIGNTGGDYNADGSNYDIPDAPSFGRHLSGQSRRKFLNGLFSASSFPAPLLGKEGNLGRNTYDQPGYANTDMTIEKLVSAPWFWGEKVNLEFRAEMVNLFNRPNLANVDGNMVDSTFGKVTGQLPARDVQFHIRAQF